MSTGSGTGTPSTAGGASGYILLSEIKALLDTHLPDISTTLFPTLIRYRQVKAAHEQYCRDWPDLGLAESAGDGGRYYAITSLISDWVEGFSQVRSVEYPAATFSSDESPAMLKRADWRDDAWALVSTVRTRHLYFPAHAPASTETMRITYTRPWLFSESSTVTSVTQSAHGFSEDDLVFYDDTQSTPVWTEAASQRLATHKIATVPSSSTFTANVLQTNAPTFHLYALSFLAASFSCQALAVQMSQAGMTLVDVDSASHDHKAMEFRASAKEFMALYRSALGLDHGPRAGSDFADLGYTPHLMRPFLLRPTLGRGT